MKARATIIKTSRAGTSHVVHSMEGGGKEYCHTPCAQCPWRIDQTGQFPAEAFRISAGTSYDMAQSNFACHMAGTETPKTCAGFLLRGADDNLSIRMQRSQGKTLEVADGGHKLHPSYREMAIANGVSEIDPVLEECMPEARERFMRMKRL